MQRVDLPSSVLFCLLPMKKLKIVVVGCGIVGATIAYELNKQTDADIVVLDQNQPFQGSTGAALGGSVLRPPPHLQAMHCVILRDCNNS